jgi:lysophospholipase L1-like esterase
MTRALVMGNSLARMVVPERTSRDEGAFGEWVERYLRADGLDVVVENWSRWYERIDEGAQRWRSSLRQLTPDVVVVVYGSAECQPNVVPTWLSRHFMTWDQRVGGVGAWYRRVVAPPIWRTVRTFQRLASARDASFTWRYPPKRYKTELLELVGMIRQEQALVLLVDIPPFGPRIEHHMPGAAARREVFQRLVRDTVAELGDPDVRIVPATPIVEELGGDAALPDGLHLTAEGHRRMGQRLVAEMGPWLRAIDDQRVATTAP